MQMSPVSFKGTIVVKDPNFKPEDYANTYLGGADHKELDCNGRNFYFFDKEN